MSEPRSKAEEPTNMAGGRPRLMIAAVVAAFLCLALPGIRWGLPSAERNALYFATPESLEESVRRVRAGIGTPTTRSLYNPVRSYHPDEYYALKMLSRMRPWSLDVDPDWYVIGGAYVYPLGATLKVADISGLVTLKDDATWYLAHPDDMARLYLVGRALAVAAAAGAIVFVMLAACQLWGRAAALIAGVTFALSPLVVMHAHFMYNDIPGTFWVAVATYAAARSFRETSWRNVVLGAAACGLAAGTKLHHGFVLALLVSAIASRKGERHLIIRQGLAAVAIAGAVFVAFNPFYLLRPAATLTNFRAHIWAGSSFAFYLKALGMGFGVLPLLVAAAGLTAVAARRQKPALVISVWAAGLFLALSLCGKQFARFAMPVLPALALMAAYVSHLGIRRYGWAAWGVVVLMLAPQVVSGVSIARAMIREDSRSAAGRAITQLVKPGDVVAVTEEPWQFETPPLDGRRCPVAISGYDYAALREIHPKAFVFSDLQSDASVNPHPEVPHEEAFWRRVLEGIAQGEWRVIYETPGDKIGLNMLSALGLWRVPPEDLRYISPRVTVLTPTDRERTEPMR